MHLKHLWHETTKDLSDTCTACKPTNADDAGCLHANTLGILEPRTTLAQLWSLPRQSLPTTGIARTDLVVTDQQAHAKHLRCALVTVISCQHLDAFGKLSHQRSSLRAQSTSHRTPDIPTAGDTLPIDSPSQANNPDCLALPPR